MDGQSERKDAHAHTANIREPSVNIDWDEDREMTRRRQANPSSDAACQTSQSDQNDGRRGRLIEGRMDVCTDGQMDAHTSLLLKGKKAGRLSLCRRGIQRSKGR